MEDLTSKEMIILLGRQLDARQHQYTCSTYQCGLPLYPIQKGWICGTCGYSQKYGELELKLIGRNENK